MPKLGINRLNCDIFTRYTPLSAIALYCFGLLPRLFLRILAASGKYLVSKNLKSQNFLDKFVELIDPASLSVTLLRIEK
ncbi:MAG: hypothetical protein L3J04_01975 [Robiginitomaculum sp.]|nr:hypothetical protein [Robiginitomaculum sp.]